MNLLLRWLFWLMLLGGSPAIATSAWGATHTPVDKDWKAIRAVITAQIEAFKRDDAVTAFSLAAPAIRDQFRTPRNFMQMVRTGYSAVYRPRSVRFLKHLIVLGRPVQALELMNQEGGITIAYYVMERQHDGSWRIAGCSLKSSNAVSV